MTLPPKIIETPLDILDEVFRQCGRGFHASKFDCTLEYIWSATNQPGEMVDKKWVVSNGSEANWAVLRTLALDSGYITPKSYTHAAAFFLSAKGWSRVKLVYNPHRDQ
jgi:hypothetical protein